MIPLGPARKALGLISFLFLILVKLSPAQEPLPTARMPDNGTGRSPFAIELKAASTGLGGDIGVQLSHKFNLRAGGTFFRYHDTQSSDGVYYHETFRLEMLEGHLDWFPWAGNFHISPGVLYYYQLPLSAAIAVPGGTSFSLDNANFISSPSDPVSGNALLHTNRISPALTVGWGNILPRVSGKHWSFPFEIGAAFHGDPTVQFGLRGTACLQDGTCVDAATSPAVLDPLHREAQKRTDDISWFKFYPIVSIGVGYRF